MSDKKTKKNFGRKENGCIFALAFAGKEGVLRSLGERRRRKDIEKVETRDSVCQTLYIKVKGGHERVKGKKREILTMKSLILAQDER